MRLRIDTSGTRFIVTRASEPRLNFETGSPKVDTATGMPLFATQVLALDDTGGEVLNVTVAGDPKVTVTYNPALIRIDGEGKLVFKMDEIGEFLGKDMTAEIFEVNTSTHYGRMVRVDDNTVILFGDMNEVMEFI